VCLLVVVSRVDPGAPLVVAANRDESLHRPATAAAVLRAREPRILGGRDEEAGGTWLAVNEHGVVAGLTNRPSREPRDASKRSRGELPLALAGHADASQAIGMFAKHFRPRDYNPAWLLVGDRHSLFYIDMTEGERPTVRELGPGVHILENNPLGDPSPKASNVRRMVDGLGSPTGDELVRGLRSVLVDHGVPQDTSGLPEGVSPAALAACVHTELYGTRSAALLRVPADPGARPSMLVADGHPCTSPLADASALWSG
jgi:uncharacterized protein with NRDE domain